MLPVSCVFPPGGAVSTRHWGESRYLSLESNRIESPLPRRNTRAQPVTRLLQRYPYHGRASHDVAYGLHTHNKTKTNNPPPLSLSLSVSLFFLSLLCRPGLRAM